MNAPVARQRFSLPEANRDQKRHSTRPKKPKAWSHQDDLKALVGKQVRLIVANREHAVIGKLVQADQFTLKVAVEGMRYKTIKGAGQEVWPDFEAGGTPYQSILTYFKSALVSYEEIIGA